MKSPLRRRISPSVPFTLTFEDAEGKFSASYRLAYNWNSLALAEMELGRNLLLEMGVILENPSITTVSILLWAALQENHEEEFAGKEGLELLRQNLTLSVARAAKEACGEAYTKQLAPEQIAAIEKAQKAAEEAAAAGQDPLAVSPTPAAQ